MRGEESDERESAPVWLFDLDGTILRSNSFPAWVTFMLKGAAPAPFPARMRAALAAGLLLAKRKAFKTSHDVFKAGLQRAWAGYDAAAPAAAEAFGARLAREIRANMADVLAIAREREDAVLATAAAGEYALPFGARLGFRNVLATPPGRAGEGSYVGERKRDEALAWLAARGWSGRPILFFTDHEEDLPLMQAADRVIWLGPDSEAPAIQARLKPGAALIPARGLDAKAVLNAALAPMQATA